MIRCVIQFVIAALLPMTAAAITLNEALAAKQDLWGLAAMRQTNGASYDFFANLLPPLRYVNAQFRYYPIVLSAPGAAQKARLVSNGSAINARAGLKTWKDAGTPVSFFVGAEQAPFGADISLLDGPRYERGYLPVVQLTYRARGIAYEEEAFADADAVRVKFKGGMITARLAPNGLAHRVANTICDENGKTLVAFDKTWEWDAANNSLTTHLSGALAIAFAQSGLSGPPDYSGQRKKCIETWERILSSAMRVETPEPIVNAAWKSTLIGCLMLERGDHMNYSAGNAYQTMYVAESGDAVAALLLWGLSGTGRRMIPPLLDYGINPGLKFHDAAFKLQLLARYYWLTRDAPFVRDQMPRWSKSVSVLTGPRDEKTGLLPPENYCGDEFEKVFSLNSDANGWRGLRDIALVLRQIGESEAANPIVSSAEALRRATLSAVDESEQLDTRPPFLPIAMFGREKPYDVLTATRRGSYYDLMLPYVIGSEIFGDHSERETWMLRYLQEHGGLCMGMIRFNQHSGLFANGDALDDCYGMRYSDALLRRDEPDPALVSFYGKLAQGMTRDTFISAEGTGLRSLDTSGRPMYLPPNATGNGFFLALLRSMLVQDYVDDTGEPKTLRLLFATPRRWLEDGQEIKIDRAPTAFGEISLRVRSHLKRGEVLAEIHPPTRNRPENTLLRIRLPEGWKILSAQCNGRALPVDSRGTVDISNQPDKTVIRFKVKSL